jgi:copper resistance protein B
MTRPVISRLCVASLAVGLLAAAPHQVLGQTSSSASAQTGGSDQHANHKPAEPSGEPHSGATTDPPDQGTSGPPAQELPSFIPRLTDEDRQAAFPDVRGHAVHDRKVNSFVLFDQLEWQAVEGVSGVNVDAKGWLGRDRDRLWFRAEADTAGRRIGDAEAHVLYGRQFSRWWDVVAGIRQDVRPGPTQTWAAIGIQGLAPYWFEVEATAYVGPSGRTHARFEVEYELLFTNRLILQPLVEIDIYGKSDPERRIGSGLSTANAGFRLRYIFRREFAPYVGVTWNRKFGQTADFAEDDGAVANGAQLVTGLRLWF